MSQMGFDPQTSCILRQLSTNWTKGDLHTEDGYESTTVSIPPLQESSYLGDDILITNIKQDRILILTLGPQVG